VSPSTTDSGRFRRVCSVAHAAIMHMDIHALLAPTTQYVPRHNKDTLGG
jgi:hypothetical protein